MPSTRQILILMSDTGGGHRSAAQAIADACARTLSGKYSVTLEDAFVRCALWPVCTAPQLYLPTITFAEWLYAFAFHVTNARTMARLLTYLLYPFTAGGLRRLFARTQPDLVVSVHPLWTTNPLRVMRAMNLRVPFVTVVTDLVDGHAAWFDRATDLCLLPNAESCARAQQFGIPEGKLRVVGLPVSLKFLTNERTKSEYRAQLGIADRTTILLVGGGEGMGPLYEIARAIDRARPPAQFVVIAGRNESLYQKLQATAWQIPVSVQRFVTNMPEWMRASDVIITKAGPGTISEALACGLPILLSGFLPGQEEGNVEFVERNGAGVMRQEPEEIARTLSEWLTPGNDALARFATRAQQLARPRAALEIAEILDQVLTAPHPTPPNLLSPLLNFAQERGEGEGGRG